MLKDLERLMECNVHEVWILAPVWGAVLVWAVGPYFVATDLPYVFLDQFMDIRSSGRQRRTLHS